VSAFCAFLLNVIRAEIFFTIFIPSLILFGGILAILPEYFIKNRYYTELQNILRQMDKRHLIQEVIRRPDFIEGRILFDMLKTTGKSMNDEISKYKTAYAEYREYIELWVHEIKTPIAGAKLIGENKGNRLALEVIDKIDSLVEQALYYARSNTVEKDYLIRSVALSELVGVALKESARFLIGREIVIQTRGLEPTVFTDAKWIIFIIRQIIDNAAKYGGTTLWFCGEQRENSVSLSIHDNGVGIPEADISRVFQKGFTGVNGRTFGQSTGFGLYLCKKLCVKLGLGISIAAQPDQGTTLTIVFPKSNA
jgi:signal transduction histidine kinase